MYLTCKDVSVTRLKEPVLPSLVGRQTSSSSYHWRRASNVRGIPLSFTLRVRSMVISIWLLFTPCLLSACSSSSQVTSAAPPTVICGTTLWNSPAGASIYNYFRSGYYQTKETLIAGQLHPIILWFSPTCNSGVSSVVATPVGLLKMKTARAKDKSIIAVAIHGLLPGNAVVTAVGANGLTTKVRVAVAAS